MKIADFITGKGQKVVEAAADENPQVKALEDQIANLEQQLDNLKKQKQQVLASISAAAPSVKAMRIPMPRKFHEDTDAPEIPLVDDSEAVDPDTDSSAADPADAFEVKLDPDSGMWCVIGTISGHCYAVCDSEADAQAKAAQLSAAANESVVVEASGTKWSDKVTADATSHSKPGLYATGSASQIANAELTREGSPGKAIKAVEFYLNRAGKNLSDARKGVIQNAVKILQAKNKKKA